MLSETSLHENSQKSPSRQGLGLCMGSKVDLSYQPLPGRVKRLGIEVIAKVFVSLYGISNYFIEILEIIEK